MRTNSDNFYPFNTNKLKKHLQQLFLLLFIISGLGLVKVQAQCNIDGGNYGPICITDDPITLIGTPPGGIWSGPGVTGNTYDPSTGGSSGNVIIIGGTNNNRVTYTYANEDSTCVGTDFVNIEVVGYDFILPDTICNGDGPISLIPFDSRGLSGIPFFLGGQPFQGQFSGPGVVLDSATAFNGNFNSYVLDPSDLNGTITITLTDTTNNCTSSQEITIIDSPEIAPITVEFCEGDAVDLTSYQDDLITEEGNFSFLTGFQNQLYIANPLIPGWSVLDLNTFGIDSLTTQSEIELIFSGIDISPDGSTVYVANDFGDLLIIDAASSTVIDTVITNSTGNNFNSFTGLILSPDGQTLYLNQDGEVKIIDLNSNMVVDSIQVTDDFNFNAIAISPDGQTLYTSDNSSNFYTIDLTTNMVDSLAINSGQTNLFGNQLFDIEVSQDGQTVYVSNPTDSTLYLVDPANNIVVDSVMFSQSIYDLEFSPDGQTLYISGFNNNFLGDGVIFELDVSSNTITNTLALPFGGGSINISPDGQTIYWASYFVGIVSVIDVNNFSLQNITYVPSVYSITIGDFLNQGTLIENPETYAAQDGDSIQVCYTSLTGCQTCTTVNFVENNAPPTEAGEYGPLCSSDAPITLGGLPAGGTWSGPGVTGDTFDPAVGTSTLIYTYDVGNCLNIDSTTIIVNEAPTPDAGMYDAVCEAEGLISLAGSPAGGTWSGAGVVDNGDGTFSFDPTGLLGINTLTYTATDASGCSASATVDIEVNEGEIIECTGDYIYGFIYMGQHNGSHYYCSYYSDYTWHEANTTAQNAGGHLAVINDADENEYIRSNIMTNNAWIGYTDEAMEDNFVWSNGEANDYENWQVGEPNNYNGNDHYTRIKKGSGEWTDRPYWMQYEFVMEVPCAENFSCEPVAACETPDNDELCYSAELIVNGDCADDCTEEATTSTWPGNYGINCGNTNPHNDLWYYASIPASGSFTVEVSEGTLTNPQIAVYYYYCGNLYILGTASDGDFNVSGPEGYVIYYRIWGDNYSTGTFSICATDQQSNKTQSTHFDLEKSIAENAINNLSIQNLSIAPNPVIDRTVVSYQLEMEDQVSLKIYDVTGKVVHQISPQRKETGFHQQPLELNNLPKGLYLLEMQGTDWQIVEEMIVIE